MPILKATSSGVEFKPGVKRKFIHGNDLMLVEIEFTNGPWSSPEPPHSHIHEQASFVAKGELMLFIEGEPEQRLGEGDMFFVPSGKLHTVQLLTKTVKLIDSFNPVRNDFLQSAEG